MKQPIAWPVDLGHLIRSERLARGLSQLTVARRVGCQPTDLARLELGEDHVVETGLIDRVAQELGLDPMAVACYTGSLFRSEAATRRMHRRARRSTFMPQRSDRGQRRGASQ